MSIDSAESSPPAGTLVDGRNDPMTIDWWRTSRLKQADDDPRRYPARDIKNAVNIIRRYGIRVPLVVARDGTVLAGFIAVLAARELGLDQLPVLVTDDLPPEQLKILSLALNRFCELGEFDEEALGALIVDLELSAPDLDPESFGFEIAEIDLAVDAASAAKPKKPEVGLPDGPPVAKLGDMSSRGDGRSRMLETLAMLRAHAPLPLPAGHTRMPPGLRISATGCIAWGFHAPLPAFTRARSDCSERARKQVYCRPRRFCPRMAAQRTNVHRDMMADNGPSAFEQIRAKAAVPVDLEPHAEAGVGP